MLLPFQSPFQRTTTSNFVMHSTPLARVNGFSAPRLLQDWALSLSRQAANLLQRPVWAPQLHKLPELAHQALRPLTKQELLHKMMRVEQENVLDLIQRYLAHLEVNAVEDLRALYQCFWASLPHQKIALQAIGRQRHVHSLSFLQEIYRSAWHQKELRHSIIRAVGLEGSPEAVAWLVKLGQKIDPNSSLQRAIIMALGYSQCAAAAEALKSRLESHAQGDERALIYRALAATGSDTAVEYLRQRQYKVYGEERQQIKSALKQAFGE